MGGTMTRLERAWAAGTAPLTPSPASGAANASAAMADPIVSDATSGPLATVSAARVLNAEWARHACDDRSMFDTVACANLRAAMAQVGLPAPESPRGEVVKVDLGPPLVVAEPTRLVAEAAKDRQVACAERCGCVMAALGVALAGTVGYQAAYASWPPATEGMSPETAEKGRLALYVGGSLAASIAGQAVCQAYCKSGPPAEVRYAEDESFVLQGVYEHEAAGEEAIERFRAYAAKSTEEAA